MAIDRARFFNSIRPLFGNTLRQPQVDGMDAILNGWERRAPNGDARWLAYMFATAFHETNRTMQPVREAYWLSEQWRRNNLRYYPYYGRGYVQLTWRENYQRAGAFVNADLVRNPDLAMDAGNAATIMFVGMEEGWFRGDARGRQTLARYFNRTVNDPVGAREIINGREVKVINGRRVLMATVIAQYHDAFVRALAAAAVSVGVREESVFFDTMPAEESVFSGSPGLESFEMATDAAADALYGEEPDSVFLIDRTVDVVTAYLNSNTMKGDDVPGFIAGVHQALAGLVAPPPGTASQESWSVPAAAYSAPEAPAKAAAKTTSRRGKRAKGGSSAPSPEN